MRLLFFLCIFCTSCAPDSNIPKEVVVPDKMERVMYDVIRADEMVDFYSLSDSVYRNFSKRSGLYDSILRIHAISKSDFQKSLQFYQTRPDLLKTIFDSLQKRASDTTKVKDTINKRRRIQKL